MSSLLEQTTDRLATKDVCQHIDYQYNHCLFLGIFVGIIDAVFLFQKVKEHFVLLRVAYLLLIANVIRHYLVAQGFLSKINQHPHRQTRRLQIIQQLRCMLCFQHLYRLEFYHNITITH